MRPLRADAAGGGGAAEFVLSDEDFSTIASILYADSGISLADHKRSLVYGRLTKRLRSLGLESFNEYCRLLQSKDGVGERQAMLSALTTNVTAFFRERHHFDYLRTSELPRLLEAARAGASVRIWSAGCSKGHEPFSIAMTLLGVMPDVDKYDVKILATDIDPAVIAFAREARYSEEDLADVPGGERSRYFERPGSDGMYVVKENVRRLVSFKELNLMGAWPMRMRYQIIFCRNVTIYFDAETQAKIWGRFADLVAPGGLICIGHSERLSGPAMRRFDLIGTTAYRHRGAA